ncbi:MAG: DUF1566 domain-containing protein [Leptospiraceae bacterium]|nr:DUF1566 domain-containing protein [Leptospiraceae bacterium]
MRCTTNGTDPTSTTPAWTQTHIWFIAGLDIKCATFVNGILSGSIQTFTYSYSVQESGQTLCYNGVGGTISCVGTGQDGEFSNGVARTYTDNGDGTITDNTTSLVWLRCTVGQTGSSCATGFPATGLNWTTATGTTCSSQTTASRIWRLPTSVELETLPDYGTSNPAINTVFFPNTVANNYWSSTSYTPDTNNAWYVEFSGGLVNFNSKLGMYRVRCVSGEMKSNSFQLTDNGEGTVKDRATGLVWQKCSSGYTNTTNCTGGSATTITWSGALSYCNSLGLAGRTWRLPSVKELNSLVDKSLSTSPTINTTIFPNTSPNFYWSSTTISSSTMIAWVVFFLNGNVNNSNKTDNNYVRCVSGP